MSQDLIIRPAAEAELAEAVLWYEVQREGLGREFLQCVDETLTAIVVTPLRFPFIHRSIRRALVRRFPYAVFFLLVNDQPIIVAVFHSKRNPADWRSRVE